MDIHGADFSGVENPSKGIYVAQAELQDADLIVTKVSPCDDRLDLFRAIVTSRAPWGLDFPFSYSSLAFPALGVSKWAECRCLAASRTRKDFLAFLKNAAPTWEGKCTQPSKGCRCTDAAANSYSPFKVNNPNLRSMTYAGLKLLAFAHDAGLRIYPFDAEPDHAKARLYEIYPSHSWKYVGVTRSAVNLESFVAAFNGRGILNVKFGPDIHADNGDSADAVVACITMAAAVQMHDIDQDWGKRPGFASPEEWGLRGKEGLIVRLFSSPSTS
jgi:hypothetical protein